MGAWTPVVSSDAGASTRARYRELAARWRRRALKRLYLLVAILLPPLVVAEALARHFGVWMLGLVTGAVVALFISVREEVPERIAKWRRGYEGEQKTAKQLARFRRRDCVVLHDLGDRRTAAYTKGNVDHVLVTPWGVFLLDSKVYSGSVSVAGDLVRVRDLDDGDSDDYVVDRLASGMRSRAARLSEDLRKHAALSAYIEPVVVFWCPFEVGSVSSNGVHYVGGEHLVRWIEDRCRDAPVRIDVEPVAAGIRAARPDKVR